MGTLFSYQKLYDEALEAKRKALQLYILQKDSTRYPYLNRDIARIFNAQGKRDSALIYYQKALDSEIIKSQQRHNIISEIGCLYYYNNETGKAKSILEGIVAEKPQASNALLFLGLIHENTGSLDSAYYYAQKTLLYGNMTKKNAAYQLLTRIKEKEGNTIQANIYWNKHLVLQDSINALIQTEEMEKYHLLYRFQRSEKEKDVWMLRNQQKQSSINYLLFTILICAVSILFLVYFYIRKKKEVEDQKLRLEEMSRKRNVAKETPVFDEPQQNSDDLEFSNIYLRFRNSIQDDTKLTEQDWEELKDYLDKRYSNLTFRIRMLYPKITLHQMRICYLVKLRFSNDNIAKVLFSSPASISIARKRLYEKITGISGKPEDLNLLISGL